MRVRVGLGYTMATQEGHWIGVHYGHTGGALHYGHTGGALDLDLY